VILLSLLLVSCFVTLLVCSAVPTWLNGFSSLLIFSKRRHSNAVCVHAFRRAEIRRFHRGVCTRVKVDPALTYLLRVVCCFFSSVWLFSLFVFCSSRCSLFCSFLSLFSTPCERMTTNASSFLSPSGAVEQPRRYSKRIRDTSSFALSSTRPITCLTNHTEPTRLCACVSG
jgi:hypothetical protein